MTTTIPKIQDATMKKTLRDFQQTETQQQELSEEKLFEMFMSEFGKEAAQGDPENTDDMMDTMMQTFFSRDILEEPIKGLTEKVL